MSPSQCFWARGILRVVQLLCFLCLLIGLAQINRLFVAIEATVDGAMTVPELCWKILPVTGLLIPAIAGIVGSYLALLHVKPATHDLDKPWLANPMWAAKHIRLSNRGVFWAIALCVLFYVGIFIPLSIGTEKTAFLVVCGVLGLVLLLMARVFWRNRKWNTAELRMASVPGVIGGPFTGVAILQQAFPSGTAFDVCLKCVETKSLRSERGSGGTSTTTETVWSSTISIDKVLQPDGPNRTLVPFSFAVPYDCEPTSVSTVHAASPTAISTRWNLVVQQKGLVGYGGSVFTVPIFRTAESRPDFEFDEELIASYQEDVDVEAVLARLQMKKEKSLTGGNQISFQNWNVSTAVLISTMSVVCMLMIVAFFWYVPNIFGAAFASIFPGVFLITGLYTLFDMFLWQSSIEIDVAGIRATSGWRGFSKSLVLEDGEYLSFVSEFDMRKENGEWYRVDLCMSDSQSNEVGPGLTIVKRLNGRSEADAISKWLAKETGGRTPLEE